MPQAPPTFITPSALASPPKSDSTPQLDHLLNDRYRLLEPLSHGGFSKTYVAQDTHCSSHTKCVVKHLQPQPQNDFDALTYPERCQRETETLGKLGHHDRIPALLDHFEIDGEFYLVQTFIEGQSLRTELNDSRSRTPPHRWCEDQVIQLLDEVLTILAFVHNQGFIHRDVKPENLIRRRQDNHWVLLDFGAVKPWSPQPITANASTRTVAIQSEGYTPLEQSYGNPCPASDFYALGIIGLEALTGEHPRTFTARLHQDSDWIGRLDISPRFGTLLKSMTRHHPEHRFQTAEKTLQNLHQPFIPESSAPLGARANLSLKETLGYTPTQIVPPSQPRLITIPLASFDSGSATPDKAMQPIKPSSNKRSQTTADTPLNADKVKPRFSRIFRFAQSSPLALPTDQAQVVATRVTRFMVMGTAGIWLSLGGYFIADLLPKPHPQSAKSTLPTMAAPVSTLTQASSLIESSSVTQIALTPDGKTLISNQKETLELWDLQTNQRTQVLTGHFDTVTAIAVSPDGRLLASGSEDANINLWNLQTGELLHTLRGHQWAVLSLTFSPDSQTLVSSAEDQTLKVWQVETGALHQTLNDFKASILSLDISPDNAFLVGGGNDHTIRVWQLSNGKLLHTLRGHLDQIQSVAISANGAVLASGSADQTIKLWNLYTGEAFQTLDSHTGSVSAIAISANGQRLVSGSDDRTLRLWNLPTGNELPDSYPTDSAVQAVTLSADGQTLISSTLSGTVQRWHLP